MGPPSGDERFNLEVVKLLLQVARVDSEVDERERQMILGAARSWNVSEPDLQLLLKDLDGGDVPEPNLSLLKTRADDVLMAARALVLTDGKVKPEETALLKQLAAKLSSP